MAEQHVGTEPTEELPRTVVPYLAVAGGGEALDFYARAFGAREVMRMDEGGLIAHAEFTIGGARFFLSDEWPSLNVRSPATLGGFSVSLAIEVADADALVERLAEHGATIERPVEAGPVEGTRAGWVVDPYGHRWHISSRGDA
ncbi:hypothetical protein GCM10009841_00920 [Microlunatus panaciterrae]|uniref:PhnB protein n=1 Tax=Microlunatus panaciterrae TaxID=400768 RepID=A0ABS2RMK3_9ACTN|nr:VOC family protein [Microlunatus panaciterrae]MBM7799174.1 PhnB protein [Microlunatus panaciterrae]